MFPSCSTVPETKPRSITRWVSDFGVEKESQTSNISARLHRKQSSASMNTFLNLVERLTGESEAALAG